MKVEALADLKKAFDEWRATKRHLREAVPAELLERSRRAARHHGPAAVARVTKMGRGRLQVDGKGGRGRREEAAGVPTFSRMELSAPGVAGRPFAEVETATGVKVRLYTQTAEALELISSVCGLGGAR